MHGRQPSPSGSPEVFRTLVRQAGLTVESLTAASAWSVSALPTAVAVYCDET